MDFQTFKQIVIETAKAQGITAYELYYQAEEARLFLLLNMRPMDLRLLWKAAYASAAV